MLTVLRVSKTKSMLVDVLRIVDFFVCFPVRLSEVRPPNSVPGMRKRCNSVIRELPNSEFELLPSSTVLFERMSVIQEAAVSAMVSKELASIVEEQGARAIQLNEDAILPRLRKNLDDFASKNAELLELVTRDFPQIPLMGSDGLKARTGLGEFQYDTV